MANTANFWLPQKCPRKENPQRLLSSQWKHHKRPRRTKHWIIEQKDAWCPKTEESLISEHWFMYPGWISSLCKIHRQCRLWLAHRSEKNNSVLLMFTPREMWDDFLQLYLNRYESTYGTVATWKCRFWEWSCALDIQQCPLAVVWKTASKLMENVKYVHQKDKSLAMSSWDTNRGKNNQELTQLSFVH